MNPMKLCNPSRIRCSFVLKQEEKGEKRNKGEGRKEICRNLPKKNPPREERESVEEVDVMPARRSHPDHQAMCSPYMLGVSPRTKASNVLFRTADQSRSRLSSATLSIHSPSSSTAPAVVRAIRSPLANRGPRSGQCRIESKGCHLKAIVSPPTTSDRTVALPEIMEVIRERALEKAVESHSLWCRTVLSRGVEEITKPRVPPHEQT